MMKHKYPTFPSDVFNIMTVLGARLTVGIKHTIYTICYDMNYYIIKLQCSIVTIEIIVFFKPLNFTVALFYEI